MNFLALIGGLVVVLCITLGLLWVANNVTIKGND